MPVVIQEFEVRPAATPAPASVTPTADTNPAPGQNPPAPAELQRALTACRERALRLFAH